MERPRFGVADVVRAHGAAFLAAHGGRTTSDQRRALRDIARCRTAALGGHVEVYACGHEVVAYNSCRTRACGRCVGHKSRAWVDAREAELLPVPYFHVVFTMPQQLARLALGHPRVLYDLLFRASSETLQQVALDERHLGAEIGFLSVLHTWGQTLTHHPHVHCVVPGGGLARDGGRWVPSRASFFLPVRVLSAVYRGKFLAHLKRSYARGDLGEIDDFAGLLDELYRTSWVVYAKRPFGGPAQVLRYLARYTHRIAIGDRRIVDVNERNVSFSYKDYNDGGAARVMALDGSEFLRRFVQHVLPGGFVRIRSYGFLANTHRTNKLALARFHLGVLPTADDLVELRDEATTVVTRACPTCGLGTLLRRVLLIKLPWNTS